MKPSGSFAFAIALCAAVLLLFTSGKANERRRAAALHKKLEARWQQDYRDSADWVFNRAKAEFDPARWIDSLVVWADIDADPDNGYWDNYRRAAAQIGELCTAIGDTARAAHWYREQYRHTAPDQRDGLSEDLHLYWSMARVCEEREEMDAALDHMRQARTALRTADHAAEVHARFYGAYADMLGSIGLYRDAVERYWVVDSVLTAEAISGRSARWADRKLENELAWAKALSELGDHREAIEMLLSSVAGSQKVGPEGTGARTSAGVERSYRLLARCYGDIGMSDSAAHYRRLAARCDPLPVVDEAARISSGLDEAWLAFQGQRPLEAASLLDGCIALQRTTGRTDRLPFSLGLRALLFARTGHAPDSAIAMAHEALTLLVSTPAEEGAVPKVEDFTDPEKAIPVLSFRSAMFETLDSAKQDDGYWEQAIASADLALECLELAGSIRTPATRAQLATQRWSAFESVVRINRTAWMQHGERRYAERAFRAMELSKNFLSTGSTSAFMHDRIDPLVSLDLRIGRLVRRIKELGNTGSVATTRKHRDPLEPWRQRQRLRESQRLDSLLKNTRAERERAMMLRNGTRAHWTLPEITSVQRALGEREVLVEYFNEQEKLYAMWIGRDSIRFDKLSKVRRGLAATINDCIAVWKPKQRGPNGGSDPRRTDLEMAEERAQAPGELYYKLLNEPMATMDPEQLIVVPDGELCRLPFEALKDEHGRILLERCAVRYGYSAGIVTERPVEHRMPNAYLGCAPVGFQSAFRGPGEGLAYVPQRGAWRSMTARDRYDSLRRSQEEVMKGRELFGGYALLNDSATESNVLRRIKESRIIHFATHGLVNLERPELSGLLLAGNRRREPRYGALLADTTDNVLYAYEIAGLDLHADLVVLSACQTSEGAYRHGEGIMSLARAFKEAGVRNVVTSLWQVDDGATAEIMRDFLTRVKGGEPKHEALRQAKLDYRQAHNDADVALWAPFILVGDDRPLNDPAPRSRWSLLALFVGGLACVAGVVFLTLRRTAGPIPGSMA